MVAHSLGFDAVVYECSSSTGKLFESMELIVMGRKIFVSKGSMALW